MTAVDVRAQLMVLQAERVEARAIGLLNDAAYRADLEQEIAVVARAYVVAAVIEIADLRAELGGHSRG